MSELVTTLRALAQALQKEAQKAEDAGQPNQEMRYLAAAQGVYEAIQVVLKMEEKKSTRL